MLLIIEMLMLFLQPLVIVPAFPIVDLLPTVLLMLIIHVLIAQPVVDLPQILLPMLIVQMLRSVESGWFQREWGLMDSTYWEGFMRSVILIIGSEGGRVALSRNRQVFTRGFADAIEKAIASRSA